MRVAIVLDPDFGDRLEKLAFQRPVWIVDTPANHTAAEAAWLRASEWPQISVTLFRPFAAAPSREDWDAFLAQLELQRRVTAIDCIGAPLTGAAQAALAGAGFTDLDETHDGFRARRP